MTSPFARYEQDAADDRQDRRIGLVERSISGLSRTLTDTFSLLGGDISSAQRVFQGVLGLGAFEVAAGKVIGGGAAAGVAGGVGTELLGGVVSYSFLASRAAAINATLLNVARSPGLSISQAASYSLLAGQFSRLGIPPLGLPTFPAVPAAVQRAAANPLFQRVGLAGGIIGGAALGIGSAVGVNNPLSIPSSPLLQEVINRVDYAYDNLIDPLNRRLEEVEESLRDYGASGVGIIQNVSTNTTSNPLYSASPLYSWPDSYDLLLRYNARSHAMLYRMGLEP